jgi:colanic acid/amylovoran biosynthesis glycosyltransferase
VRLSPRHCQLAGSEGLLAGGYRSLTSPLPGEATIARHEPGPNLGGVRTPRGPSRALHATWGFGGATETFIVDRMIELERLGWEAWVAAKWMLPAPVFEFPPPERVLAPGRRERLVRRLRLGRRGREWWWLERPIATLEPALIHAHFGWVARDALGAAQHYGIPLVAGFHGYDATVYPRHGFEVHNEPDASRAPSHGVYDELFDNADCIFATSRFIASKLRELGCKREIEVVPSGIRLECYPFRGPRAQAAAGEYRLLFVGRLVPYKGLDVLIQAVARLADENDEPPTLTVVGDGPAREECEALARSLDVASRVSFRGVQSRPEVLAALREADVLVAPSRTTPAGQAEGLGNVVKEALAVGLEVAVSANGGLPEVIPPDRDGELVGEGDPIALAERLDAMRERRAEWGERARSGRRWVEEAFDWRKLAPRIGDAYRRVVDERRSAG